MKKGFVFNHPRVINEDRTPMKYIVTRVASDVVYFKSLDENGKPVGGASYIDKNRFESWISKVPQNV